MRIPRLRKASGGSSVGEDLAAVLPRGAPPWYRTRSLVLLNLLLFIPLLSSATIGYDGAMMNSLVTVKPWRDYFDDPQPSILGLMNAIYPIGKLMGLLATTWLSDHHGRKSAMWVGFWSLLAGSILQAASVKCGMFIASRWFLGVGTAFITQPSPIIITEVAYPTHRGKITALYGTFFFTGSVAATWLTYGTYAMESNWSWRIPSLLQGAIPAFQLLFFYWVPESPRWLIAKGRDDEAHKILTKFHGKGSPDSPLVSYEMAQIKASLGEEAEALAHVTWPDLVRQPANRKRTLIAIIVGFFYQWTGATVVSYYIRLVLDAIGITDAEEQIRINGYLQMFNWASAILGALLVDRVGRRKLFLFSVAGMFASYVAWTALTSVFTVHMTQSVGNAVVPCIFLYYFFYVVAWSPLLHAYPVEIFSYPLRSRGMAITYSSTFIGLIIGQLVNPIALADIGWKYYIVFCCILFVLFFVILWLFPETRGRTLEQIAEVFEGKAAGKDEESVASKRPSDSGAVAKGEADLVEKVISESSEVSMREDVGKMKEQD